MHFRQQPLLRRLFKDPLLSHTTGYYTWIGVAQACYPIIATVNFSFSFHAKENCQPFELLVDECEDLAMLFLTTCPQSHLWFQYGGWARPVHGGRTILVPGS